MTAKCIILLLDGNWNDADLGASDTNIVRLREIIARSLDHDSMLRPQAASALTTSDQKLVAPRPFQDDARRDQRVSGHQGIGGRAPQPRHSDRRIADDRRASAASVCWR
jgi:hypothetical protein